MIEPGTQIKDGRYRVVRVLGEGTQGTTFEAVDAKEGRLVCLKRFVVRGAASWKEVELAEREAHVLRSLDHPLVPHFIENFEEDGALYLVTELVEGSSLSALQRAGERFDVDRVVRLVEDLADATRYLHGGAPPVIHRDIKPANVVCRKDGRFCLVDFGAVRAKLAKSGGSTVAGTFGFMAPEQFQGRALPQSDIYGIGATAIAMLTGQQPEDLPHRGLKIDVRTALGRHAPDELVEALSAMLEPDPDVRPATLERVLERLRRVGRSETKKERKRRERDDRHDKDRERRSEKKERKRHRSPRERIHERMRRPRHPLELGPPRLVAKIALRIAQLAVLLSVVLFVPLLLATLSLVFGKPLRIAAGKVREAGHRALRKIRETRDEALGYAGERVSFSREDLRADTAPKVRVDAATPTPARTQEMEEFDVALEELQAEQEAAAGEDRARRILDESRAREATVRKHGSRP